MESMADSRNSPGIPYSYWSFYEGMMLDEMGTEME